MFYEYKHLGKGDYFLKEYNENFSFPPHIHLSFEFITVFEGKMTVTVDGKEYHLSAGEGCLIFPNQLHALSSVSSRHMLCIFSPDLVSAYRAKIEKMLPKESLFLPDPDLIDALDRLGEDANVIRKKGLLYLLCAAFDEKASYFKREGDGKKLLSSIFAFVEERYREECTLQDLAAVLGYDYAYLSRYFKKSTALSFTEYLNRYRLNKACYLLDNTDASIVQCAFDVGYNSLRTFNRNFKRIFSMSPAEYRKKAE